MATSFDAESYRKEATDAGIPQSIIKQTIAEHGQGDVATKPTQADVQIGNGYEFLEPAAYALAGTAAVSQAPTIYKSIKDRFMAPSQSAAPIEPMMDVSQRPVGRQEPRMVGDLFPADVSTKQTFGPTPENPTVDLNTKINNEPKDMGIVKKGKENTLLNEMADTRKTGINPFEGATELRTGTGKAAYEGMNPEGKLRSAYNSIKDVPTGMAFIPKGQYVDVLRNDLGQPTYTKSFTGRELPTQYRGAPEAAVETAQGINRGLNRETREAMLARGVPKSDLPEPTKGILERIGGPKGSKIVTIGGAVGALTAIPNLVHAAQGAEEKDLQKAWGSLVEGAGQFLGPLGAIGGGLFGLSPEELDTLRKSKQSPKIGIPPPR
jgi:hypothetical protein